MDYRDMGLENKLKSKHPNRTPTPPHANFPSPQVHDLDIKVTEPGGGGTL